MTTDVLEEKSETEIKGSETGGQELKPWTGFPDSYSVPETKVEMSYRPNDLAIPRNGGGDIDLWDYPAGPYTE